MNLITTTTLVDVMSAKWILLTTSTGGSFHFGTPQEVDQIHAKGLPLMVCYIPRLTFPINTLKKSQGYCTSSWELVVYNHLPSEYQVTDDTQILELWNGMETLILNWYEDVMNHFEGEGQIIETTAPMTITRLKEASNDRLLGMKVTLGWDFFRSCVDLK